MKKILFAMLAMLALTISAVPVMASDGQIQTISGVVDVVDTQYFLDTAEGRIHLDFGPSWYEPEESEAERPNDGDTITVRGKLTGVGTLDAEMDVYEIDGEWWRDAGRPPWVGPHPQGK